jgi:hypothetical protein
LEAPTGAFRHGGDHDLGWATLHAVPDATP